MTAVRRVGILGGTFDPVHSGHLMIAERALAELGLDQVLFVTAGSPRLKRQAPSAASEHRLEMVRLAVEHDGRFAVSDAEIHRHGPTYTVDTLEHVLREYGSGDELYFILGVDVLPRFHEWRNSERILELCRLVVVSRPGYSAFDWDDLRQLVRRTQMIEPNRIVAACLKGFAFLKELDPAEAALAADPHQRDHVLWTMLRDDLPVGPN